MSNFKCVNGHDRCKEMTPCQECPYCEIKPRVMKSFIRRLTKKNGRDAATVFHADRHLYPDTC